MPAQTGGQRSPQSMQRPWTVSGLDPGTGDGRREKRQKTVKTGVTPKSRRLSRGAPWNPCAHSIFWAAKLSAMGQIAVLCMMAPRMLDKRCRPAVRCGQDESTTS